MCRSVTPGERFLALTLLWTWLWWLPAAAWGGDAGRGPTTGLIVLGGLGPLLVALGSLYFLDLPAVRHDYRRRLLDVRHVGPAWATLALLLPPPFSALAALSYRVETGHWPAAFSSEPLRSGPLGLLGFALFTLLFGPLPEEMGWRGYALGPLQARRSALGASLLLGAVWAFWHLPLFFLAGTYQDRLRLASLGGALFLSGLPVQSVLLTWLFNNTRGSTLTAIAFHYTTNLTGELFPLPLRAELHRAAWTAVAALVVIVVFGPRRLRRGGVPVAPAV